VREKSHMMLKNVPIVAKKATAGEWVPQTGENISSLQQGES